MTKTESSAARVVYSETTEQVLSEGRLRTLLGITVKSLAQDQLLETQSLGRFAQTIAEELRDGPEDIPSAVLYLFREGAPILAESAISVNGLLDLDRWPWANALNSDTPTLVQHLQKCFSNHTFHPWPEPVTSAYVLPLCLLGLSVQASVVYGISPRLPFDEPYETFFQLVGARVAGLLS